MSVQQKTAAFKSHPSEIHPTSVGEIASPSKWIKKIFRANAMERMFSCVVATRAAAIAPVGTNKSVKAIPKQQSASVALEVKSVSQQNGSAATNE